MSASTTVTAATGCLCPPMWHGAVPPYCPVHNPGTGYSFTSDRIGWVEPVRCPMPLSDADVDRIARRLAEIVGPVLRALPVDGPADDEASRSIAKQQKRDKRRPLSRRTK